MRDGMTSAQSYYFGRAIAYVLTMLHPVVNISKTFGEIYNKIIEEEEDFRSSDRFHYIFEDLYKNSKEEKWVEYFKGVNKGVLEVMKVRGIKEDGSHLIKMKDSKKILNLVDVVDSFIKSKQQEKYVIGRNEEFNTEKAKIYVTNISIIYKMQKIRNSTYMEGLAGDIGRKISKSNEVISAIGRIIGSFGSFINNFGVKIGGIIEVPEEIVGIVSPTENFEGSPLPIYEENEENTLEEENIKKKRDINNLDKIKLNVLQCKPRKKEEEEKNLDNSLEEDHNKRISMKDFNIKEE